MTAVAHLVDRMGAETDIYIVTSDRDLGDRSPYAGVSTSQWVEREGCRVFYTARRKMTVRRVRRLIQEIEPDTVYLNALFSPRFSAVPVIACRSRRRAPRVVIAPTGSLNSSAVAQKWLKKRLYLGVTRALRLERRLWWHAASEDEATAIRRELPAARVAVVPHFPPPLAPRGLPKPPKESGHVRLIFLGRLHPIKNLMYALERLKQTVGTVDLTIAGAVEDQEYWVRCQSLAATIPHVRMESLGAVAPEEITTLLSRHHVLVHPSLTENYGYAILESLGHGLVVMASDRIPWRALEKLGAGWCISLDDDRAWERSLQTCIDMDQQTYSCMSEAATSAGVSLVDDESIRRLHRDLLGLGPYRAPTG